LSLRLFAALLGPLFPGCAARTVVIQSLPDQAEVSFTSGGGNRVSLGKTPVTVASAEFPQVFSSGGTFEIQKDGFTPELIVLPQTAIESTVSLSVHLRETKAGDSCAHAAAVTLARGVAMAQQQIVGHRFLEAETTLNSLTVAYPNLSVIYDLLGNMYYLQRDVPRAIAAYRRSVELDPSNAYTQTLLNKLQTLSTSNKP
jgi:hypothetical protein